MEVMCAEQPRTLTLAERAELVRRQRSLTIADLAREVGCSRPTLSRYLSGTYDKNPAKIENALTEFLDAFGVEKVAVSPHRLPHHRVELLESYDAKNILGLCRIAQEDNDMGLIVGRSGFGKTHTLRYYARTHKVIYVECDECMGVQDVLCEVEKPLHLPKYHTSSSQRASRLKQYFAANPGYLLIIDEADKLLASPSKRRIEILRSVFDQSTLGVVFAGEPGLREQIENQLPRLANRIGPYYKLEGLTAQEVRQYLEGFDIDEDALKELTRRACNARNGCFRLLDRTLRNVFRLLGQQEDQRITLNVIDAACDMMLL